MVIGLAVAVWIFLMVIAVALCRMAARADEATDSAFVDRDVVRAELSRRASARPAPRESTHRVLFPH